MVNQLDYLINDKNCSQAMSTPTKHNWWDSNEKLSNRYIGAVCKVDAAI